ncbi:hypothetical protein [Rhizobium sp. 62_C5_N11_2]|uniref:hypothetical protein n=1 Tax=Rhizobium sp. 62_C5_N11_2 TaxID=3240772 RepID=UPI003F20757E
MAPTDLQATGMVDGDDAPGQRHFQRVVILERVLDAVDAALDLGQPRLVVSQCRITLGISLNLGLKRIIALAKGR